MLSRFIICLSLATDLAILLLAIFIVKPLWIMLLIFLSAGMKGWYKYRRSNKRINSLFRPKQLYQS